MLFALGVRSHVGLSVSPDRNPPYILMSDGSVRNSYTLKLRNMESRPREMEITLQGLPGGVMWTGTGGRDAAARTLTKTVPADQVLAVRAFVVRPEGADTQEFSFRVTSRDEQRETAVAEARFDTPGGSE
jgi:polyferredoxin